MNTFFNNIHSFLFNIFLVYFFFSLYFKFFEIKTNRLMNEIIIALISGISIVLCMTFPIHTPNGYIADLRQIPFIVGALYGGRRVAVFSAFILLSYRFYLGVDDFIVILTVYFLLTISLWSVIPVFNRTIDIRKKLYLALLASFFGVISRTILLFLFMTEKTTLDSIGFFIGSLTIQTIGIILFVFFNEKSRSDAALSKEINKLEKLKTVSALAASISHEVRNPLTVTKGFLQLLREPGLTDQDKNGYVETALEALENAETIITDYLTFAKPSLENIRILDIHKKLTNIKNFTMPYAMMNNVEIEVSLEENIYIVGEKEKVHQCLINVVKNGIEAMPQGGKLKIGLKRSGDDAMITIADTGIGMNEEQLERLGNPFFTTKDIGTGLGTMVVYSVVKSLGGEINVDSELGNGTCFTIFLPAVEHLDLSV
ncbi:sensor histidine kinase [Domibacillus tundrae]|uniref:sensor histidine kinase n=1 Tax=Domibacillus tundrae TaxID=1587527 RepID=UPI000617ECE0|nr:HAMP domain-containing sensor histidine kinase [Domibacillus tundrae]